MLNLSLTACSFHLRKTNSKGNDKILSLNESFEIDLEEGKKQCFKNASELFVSFYKNHSTLFKDDSRNQSFRCEYDEKNCCETDLYYMQCVKIFSGIYGSSSEIIDGNTETVQYNKKPSDIDIRPFYLMIIFPKDKEDLIVQKGMFIFQNIGQFGVKTVTTDLMRKYFSENFKYTLKCNTIAPELFIKKVIQKDNVKKLSMIKNIKSNDLADNMNSGYGVEIREISKLSFKESVWEKIMSKIRYAASGKYNLFEFEEKTYDNLKLVVDIGGRNRTINIHNLENLSIIEAIPDTIRNEKGNANFTLLIDYFKTVADEYLNEMVLRIS